MAEFDILKVYFGKNSTEMELEIDNANKDLKVVGSTSLPNDVMVWDGENPQPEGFWIWEGHYHLFLLFERATVEKPNPLIIDNTRYYSEGENDMKYVDIVLIEETGSGKKTKKVRRSAVIVSSGGG